MTHLKNMFSHVRSVFAHSCCLSCTCMALNSKCVQAGWIIHNLVSFFFLTNPSSFIIQPPPCSLSDYIRRHQTVSRMYSRETEKKCRVWPTSFSALPLFTSRWQNRADMPQLKRQRRFSVMVHWGAERGQLISLEFIKDMAHSSERLHRFIWWWVQDRSGSPNPDLTSLHQFCSAAAPEGTVLHASLCSVSFFRV